MTDIDMPAGAGIVNWANPEPWTEQGSCTQLGPGIADAMFFPATTGPASRAAINVCSGCPVREQCLSYAMDHRIQHGIWGGLTSEQRLNLRKSRRAS